MGRSSREKIKLWSERLTRFCREIVRGFGVGRRPKWKTRNLGDPRRVIPRSTFCFQFADGSKYLGNKKGVANSPLISTVWFSRIIPKTGPV